MPRTPKKPTVEEKWSLLAEQVRKEAQNLPPGRARDAMLTKARQLDTASHLKDWISSPGLRPPIEQHSDE